MSLFLFASQKLSETDPLDARACLQEADSKGLVYRCATWGGLKARHLTYRVKQELSGDRDWTWLSRKKQTLAACGRKQTSWHLQVRPRPGQQEWVRDKGPAEVIPRVGMTWVGPSAQKFRRMEQV